MRVKVGREWSRNEPRQISGSEVAWSGGFALLVHGEHHTGTLMSDGGHRQSDYDPNYNINEQETLANPGSKGVE